MSDALPIPVSTTGDIAGRTGSQHLALVLGIEVRGAEAGAAPRPDDAGDEASHVEAAVRRMAERAVALGADGVVGMRVVTTPLGAGAVEVLVYGTAVSITNVM